MPEETINMTMEAHRDLVAKAADGERYRRFLKAELRRLGKLVGDAALVQFAVEKVDDCAKLEKMRKELQAKWDQVLPPRSQIQMSTEPPQVLAAPTDPTAQRIYDGLGVTAEQVEKYKDK